MSLLFFYFRLFLHRLAFFCLFAFGCLLFAQATVTATEKTESESETTQVAKTTEAAESSPEVAEKTEEKQRQELEQRYKKYQQRREMFHRGEGFPLCSLQRCGLVDAQGKPIFSEMFQQIGFLRHDLAIFIQDDLLGVIHRNGKVVIPPLAEELQITEHGDILQTTDELNSLYNSAGKLMLQTPEEIQVWRGGYYAGGNSIDRILQTMMTGFGINSNDNTQVWNKQGQKLGEFKAFFDPFSVAATEVPDKPLKGGIHPFYEAFRNSVYRSPLALASRDGHAFGYVNEQAKFVIEPIYLRATPFLDGFALVVGSDLVAKWIDAKGNMISHDELARHLTKYNLEIPVDILGDLADIFAHPEKAITNPDIAEQILSRYLPAGLEPLSFFRMGYISPYGFSAANDQGLVGVVNLRGEQLIAPIYDEIRNVGVFAPYVVVVRKPTAEEKLQLSEDESTSEKDYFSNSRTARSKLFLDGLVNLKGEVILPQKYHIEPIKEETSISSLFSVSSAEGQGIFDAETKRWLLQPQQCSEAQLLGEKTLACRRSEDSTWIYSSLDHPQQEWFQSEQRAEEAYSKKGAMDFFSLDTSFYFITNEDGTKQLLDADRVRLIPQPIQEVSFLFQSDNSKTDRAVVQLGYASSESLIDRDGNIITTFYEAFPQWWEEDQELLQAEEAKAQQKATDRMKCSVSNTSCSSCGSQLGETAEAVGTAETVETASEAETETALQKAEPSEPK